MSKTLECALAFVLLRSCVSTFYHAACVTCVANNHGTFNTIGGGNAHGASPLWCSLHFSNALTHADTCDCAVDKVCTYNAHYSWQAGILTVAYSHAFPNGCVVQTAVRCTKRTSAHFNYDAPGGNGMALAHLAALDPAPPQAKKACALHHDRYYPKSINYVSSIMHLPLPSLNRMFYFVFERKFT